MNPTIRGGLALAALSVFALFAADYAAGRIALGPWLRPICVPGNAVEPRDRRDVVLDLRRNDPNWFPAVPANAYLESRLNWADGQRVVPLGGVAEAQVLGCNDSGYFSSFATDAFGFNNPRDAWDASKGRKVFVIGDSYVQGDCRKPGETIVDRMRETVPGIVNLGSGGNGPLLELAAVREYVSSGDVKAVVWVYSEDSDLDDLERDRRNEVLKRYFDDPGFSQSLRARQAEVNAVVRQHVDHLIADYAQGRPRVLPALRQAVWEATHKEWKLAVGSQKPVQASPPLDVAMLGQVLDKARREVQAKGGRFLFVYLPGFNRVAGRPVNHAAGHRDRVLAELGRLGIDTLDLAGVAEGSPDPLALYPYRQKGHFNTEGSQRVAARIASALLAESSVASR